MVQAMQTLDTEGLSMIFADVSHSKCTNMIIYNKCTGIAYGVQQAQSLDVEHRQEVIEAKKLLNLILTTRAMIKAAREKVTSLL